MYFPVGWPKFLKLPNGGTSTVKYVAANRDRDYFAVLTDDRVNIWLSKPCIQIVYHQQSSDSLMTVGVNQILQWRPDSTMLVVATSKNYLCFYNLEEEERLGGLFEQQDSTVASLKRESAELFSKQKIPCLLLVSSYCTYLPGAICSLTCIREELMVATSESHVWRVKWDGKINEEYCIDVGTVPFSSDQLLSRACTLDVSDVHIKDLEYSPLFGGFSIVLSNGKAALLLSSTLMFDPKTVQGIWAPEINCATLTAINHRFRLIAYGLESAEGAVFCLDETTGALQLSHKLALSTKDFPDATSAAGAVCCLKWTPDGTALAMAWKRGGFSLWSVFGSLLTCSLSWDCGTVDVLKNNPLTIHSLEWGMAGYHLWFVVNHTEKVDQDSPSSERYSQMRLSTLQFAKSALASNTGMTGKKHVLLQGENRLYISMGADLLHTQSSFLSTSFPLDALDEEDHVPLQTLNGPPVMVGNKQWIIVPIPYSYIGTNWPIRFSAIDPGGKCVAIAGKGGLAHYSLVQKKWKLFGNETQEQDFVVTGGLLWWEDHIILGCFNFRENRDEIRAYPCDTKLDNQFVRVAKLPTQVLQMSAEGDRLLIFCADSHLILFHFQRKTTPSKSSLHVVPILEVDICKLVIHPAFVVSITLTSFRTETGRWPETGPESFLLNICGRLVLLQRDSIQRSSDVIDNSSTQVKPQYTGQTVLASCVENVWVSSYSSQVMPHLTEALWIACGAHGMRVWLPLFPCDGQKMRAHNFMSKRIMLPVHIPIYPLAVLFEDAVILGVENDTLLCIADGFTTLPLCIVSRSSQVYLHHILRQLLRRNLGYHAWEIARSCANLPYFPHSLELLLHEVLEEEATSSEPIPDALLPRVIDFIQEFPVFLQAVVQCARKTELALWPHLFSAVGNPRSLFQACITQNQLETAASYLIILQSLEVASVSRKYATLLLDAALDSSKWELSKDLVRFLRAIDPDDADSSPRILASFCRPTKYHFSHPTTPFAPVEDDLSLVLGTVSLPRGRSFSTSNGPKSPTYQVTAASPPQGNKEPAKIGQCSVPEKRRSSSREGSTAEEFFIDTILARHARKLLAVGQLRDLGYFAAYLDFPLIGFLRKERSRSGGIDDFVAALKTLHHDFSWPFPALPVSVALNMVKKNIATPTIGASGVSSLSMESIHLRNQDMHDIGDSGYLSNCMGDLAHRSSIQPWKYLPNRSKDTQTSQTIEAQLSPKEHEENESLLTLDMSEDSSLWSEEIFSSVDDALWAGTDFSSTLEAVSQELASRGSQKAEVQLRYLLQVMLEAGCLEWSLVIAVVLRDTMAMARVVNAVCQPSLHLETAHLLREGLLAMDKWAETECLGYKPFMLTARTYVKSLSKFVNSKPQVLKLHSQSSMEAAVLDNLGRTEEIHPDQPLLSFPSKAKEPAATSEDTSDASDSVFLEEKSVHGPVHELDTKGSSSQCIVS